MPTESAFDSIFDRFSRYELETLFGGRRLKDYSVLTYIGSGIKICNIIDDITVHTSY